MADGTPGVGPEDEAQVSSESRSSLTPIDPKIDPKKAWKFLQIPMRDPQLDEIAQTIQVDPAQIDERKREWFNNLLDSRQQLTTDGNKIDLKTALERIETEMEARALIGEFLTTTPQPTVSMMEKWLGRQDVQGGHEQPTTTGIDTIDDDNEDDKRKGLQEFFNPRLTTDTEDPESGKAQ